MGRAASKARPRLGEEEKTRQLRCSGHFNVGCWALPYCPQNDGQRPLKPGTYHFSRKLSLAGILLQQKRVYIATKSHPTSVAEKKEFVPGYLS